MTQLVEETAEQMSAEFKYYKNIFHFIFVLEYTQDMNFIEAIEYSLSKLNFKSLKEGQRKAVDGYLSDAIQALDFYMIYCTFS